MNPYYCKDRHWYFEETEEDRNIKRKHKTEDSRASTKSSRKHDKKFLRGHKG